MQLTDQMKAEIDSISKYVIGTEPTRTLIRKDILGKRLTPNSKKFIIENVGILSDYKVKLENLLCETDLKERGHLNQLRFGMLHTVRIIRYD